jgi:tetratricopeptide (TPR) repeat protein
MKYVLKRFVIACIIACMPFTPSLTARTPATQSAKAEKKSPPRGKTVDIGVTQWHTEQVDFKDILARAKKEKKIVLVLFSRRGSYLWRHIKKRLFNHDGARQISREAVLYNVEGGQARGKAFAKIHRILKYPAFKLFTSGGRLLDTNYFTTMYSMKTADLVDWVYAVKDGRGPGVREKSIAIGELNWLTEQNPPEQIFALAKKQGKPILILYTDYWGKRSQKAMAGIFKSQAFALSAPRALLLNIEQTSPRAHDYVKTYKLNMAPSVLLLSPEGKVLERHRRSLSNAASFCTWFDDVVSGDNRANLEQRVKNQPENREAMIKLARKSGKFNDGRLLDLLRRVIDLNPDIYDPLTQEAYERMAAFLVTRLELLNGAEKRKYVKTFHNDFMTAYYSYYPDMFKHKLKDPKVKFHYVLKWLNSSETPREGAVYFRDFSKSLGGVSAAGYMLSYFRTIEQGLELLLKLGRVGEAENWLDKMLAAVSEADEGSDPADTRSLRNKLKLYQFYAPFIRFYAGKGEMSRAEAYVDKAIQALSQSNFGLQLASSMKKGWARKYGIFPNLMLNKINADLAKEKDMEKRITLLCDKAVILYRSGDEEASGRVLRDLSDHPPDIKIAGVKPDAAKLTGVIAWHMVNAEVVTDETFDLAKKAVSLDPSSRNYYILATACMEKEMIPQAVRHLEKALQLSTNKWEKDMYRNKLAIWRLF